MKPVAQALAIGFAGFLGALCRFYATMLCTALLGAEFPLGTMIVNLSGSFFLGWFLTEFGQRIDETTRLGVAVGFVGAYTTFSTLMYDSHSFLMRREWAKAGLNLFGSAALGLVAVWAGCRLARRA